eukprot:9464853-Heterocapsa_arctica.AAC.1
MPMIAIMARIHHHEAEVALLEEHADVRHHGRIHHHEAEVALLEEHADDRHHGRIHHHEAELSFWTNMPMIAIMAAIALMSPLKTLCSVADPRKSENIFKTWGTQQQGVLSQYGPHIASIYTIQSDPMPPKH